MEKKRTPAVSVIFYIIGILLLLVSAFMLYTAVIYTKNYLQAYDATFADMWSNSVQYVIVQFVPYLGMGIICLGLGKAIKEAKASGSKAEQPAQMSSDQHASVTADTEALKEANSKLAEKIHYLSDEIDTTREVLSIKIEEKEKRDTYRLEKLGDRLEAALAALDEPVKIYVDETAEEPTPEAAEEPTSETAEEPAVAAEPAGPVPQFFRAAKVMAMPGVPAVKKSAFVPSIMRMTNRMTMPKAGQEN